MAEAAWTAWRLPDELRSDAAMATAIRLEVVARMATWRRSWRERLPARRTAITRDHFAAQRWLGAGAVVTVVASSRNADGEQRKGVLHDFWYWGERKKRWAAWTTRQW
jgi:hypothetical protein